MAAHVAVATIDPFDPRATGAYLCTGTVTKSWKDTDYIKFDGVVGSDGTFMLFLNPSPTNDQPCVWYTGVSGATAQNTVDLSNQYLKTQSATGLAYAATELTINTLNGQQQAYYSPPQVRARIVSAAVKITYSGNTLYDGGVAYALTEPNHENLKGQTVQFIQQYKACKAQRMSTRGVIELVIAPTTRHHMEFSPTLDDVNISYPEGIQAYAANNNLVGFTFGPLPIQTSALASTTIPLVPTDVFNMGRNISNLFYPLSRKNQFVNMVNDQSQNITFVVGGQMTPTNANALNKDITYVLANEESNAYFFYAAFNYVANSWWVYNYPAGTLPLGAETNTPYTFYRYTVETATPSVCFLNMGTQNANQTVHIEYTIHVEYSGIGVNRKASNNPPDEHGLAVVHSALNAARDMVGSNEHASLKHSFNEAVHAVGHHTSTEFKKTLIDTVCPEAHLAADIGHDAAMIGKRLRHMF